MLHDTPSLDGLGPADPARPGSRPGYPAMGAVTTPLVGLLHRRGELRETLPAAASIDAYVRDGA